MGKSKIQNPKSKIKEDIFLLLDPGAADGRLRFLFVNGRGEIAVRYAFAPHRKAIEHVLAIIAEKMKRRARTLKDIKGIAVMQGGESFSAVRGVHAIANALAWSLKVPAATIKKSNNQEINENNLKCVNALKRRRSFNLLLPAYSRPPNITINR
ncbi:hypothetical protein A3J43_02705 [Candidatus Uhrbacteria bacterium RIFCSPHIGHO2_12_FULL_54_23]|uniref:Gcp-like domain-containing protein n=1 Tax=Candidatus Uhrbacteria bacterium RIFCSPHIGHO2_12_FULL_54_23 TaxID=1802397 RepID=A0A1F7UPB3_9BACT|nr:MAG: hypothetical protein A3J43_02705 [Candidatus Uhrbacteria bacterium RIFCSPHIGHO2_12_FULL_54_23]